MVEVLKLVGNDGGEQLINKDAVKLSSQLRKLLDDLDTSAPIPVEAADSATLAKIVSYLTFHHENPLPSTSQSDSFKTIESWDKTYLEENENTLSAIIEAADFLQIEDLLLLSSWYIGNKIKTMTVDEIREKFNLQNDLTPEEIEEIKKEDEEAFGKSDKMEESK